MRSLVIILMCALFIGASCNPVIDRSIDVARAGDITVIFKGPCSNAPGRGIDICRYTEGSVIPTDAAIRLYFPTDYNYKAIARVSVRGRVPIEVDIPKGQRFLDVLLISLFNEGHVWSKDDQQLIGIQVEATFTNGDEGKALMPIMMGFVLIRVLSPGYSEIPIDSSEAAWKWEEDKTNMIMSTSGRTAIKWQD